MVRTFIALPAGIARMKQAKFQLYTFARLLALVLRASPMSAPGWVSAGTMTRALRDVMHRFDGVIVALLLVAVGVVRVASLAPPARRRNRA